jgi:hypothetical protein
LEMPLPFIMVSIGLNVPRLSYTERNNWCFRCPGSTLMACEKTDRMCRGLELEPLYADVI